MKDVKPKRKYKNASKIVKNALAAAQPNQTPNQDHHGNNKNKMG